MQRAKGAVLALLAPAVFVGLACGQATESGDSQPGSCPADRVAILYIGSSYLAAGMPSLVEGLAAADGINTCWEGEIIPGMLLATHASRSATLEVIRMRAWDFVVLQDAGPNAVTAEGAHGLYDALATLRERVQANAPSTRVIFMMPWAFEDGMLWAGGTDDYFAMQDRIRTTTVRWAKELDFVLAPVGWSFREVMREGPPLHYLFQSDFNHPSTRGAYLASSTLCVTLFQRDVTAVSFDGDLRAEEARHLRAVASAVTLSEREAWNMLLFPAL
jgi:hypothetical protein